MSCPTAQRLDRAVDLAIRDRNVFAHKLAFQRKEPTTEQVDELKDLRTRILENKQTLADHEATCTDCLAPVERNTACAPSSSTPAASSPATSAPSSP